MERKGLLHAGDKESCKYPLDNLCVSIVAY